MRFRAKAIEKRWRRSGLRFFAVEPLFKSRRSKMQWFRDNQRSKNDYVEL